MSEMMVGGRGMFYTGYKAAIKDATEILKALARSSTSEDERDAYANGAIAVHKLFKGEGNE